MWIIIRNGQETFRIQSNSTAVVTSCISEDEHKYQRWRKALSLILFETKRDTVCVKVLLKICKKI